MNTSIAALKRSRSNLDALTKELSGVSSNTKQSYVDDRFWKPELDKTGNGYAVLRFLPAVKDEDLPWVKMWSHAFQGPGGWYIENSLTTMNQKDPVSEENSRLWNSGIEADKEIARKRKRKLSYYANVLIVSDPKHPENEGQVKLFKFGKKIFDKITDKMQPQFEDEKPINPFDFWEGADFKLKIRKVDGFWNYDKSEFDSTKPIADNDESIEGIWTKQYPLKPFLEAANFKSYDELKSKLDKVLTGSRNTGTVEDMVTPPSVSETKPETTVEAVAASSSNDSVDDDETLSYFSKLAEEE
jgi:hypothetical protein